MRKKLAKIEVLSAEVSEKRLDDLLVFDARCIDAETMRELVRQWPRLRQVQRAWSLRFEQRGCLACGNGKKNPIQKRGRGSIVAKAAAQLRRNGVKWDAIYVAIGKNRAEMSHTERFNFEQAVRYRMRSIAAHLDVPPPEVHLHVPSRETSQLSGPGGLCRRCYQRERKELLRNIRKMNEGRDPERDTAALTRRFDIAQWLLSGGDE
jgi:hypothetical protein